MKHIVPILLLIFLIIISGCSIKARSKISINEIENANLQNLEFVHIELKYAGRDAPAEVTEKIMDGLKDGLQGIGYKITKEKQKKNTLNIKIKVYKYTKYYSEFRATVKFYNDNTLISTLNSHSFTKRVRKFFCSCAEDVFVDSVINYIKKRIPHDI